MRPLDGYDHPEACTLLETHPANTRRKVGIAIASICAAASAAVLALFINGLRCAEETDGRDGTGYAGVPNARRQSKQRSTYSV